MTRPLILAHRGDHRRVPENSIAAMDAADRTGCDGVEVDLRRLRDGTWVLHHDPHVRIGRRRAALRTLGLVRLRQAAAHVPTLDEFLAWSAAHRSSVLDLEIKQAPRRLATILHRLDPLAERRRRVTSFELPILRRVRKEREDWTLGLIRRSRDPRDVAQARRARLDFIVLHRSSAVPRMLDAARNASLDVWVWGVDTLRPYHRLVDAGVRAFITDSPRRLLEARGR